MIQFDLKLWKTGEYKVATRIGQVVHNLTDFSPCESPGGPLIGKLEFMPGRFSILHWFEDGKFLSKDPHANDLILIQLLKKS